MEADIKNIYQYHTNNIKKKLLEDVNNLFINDDNEERYGKCEWCGDILPLSDLRKEEKLGYLCNHCIKGIESREGPLSFEK